LSPAAVARAGSTAVAAKEPTVFLKKTDPFRHVLKERRALQLVRPGKRTSQEAEMSFANLSSAKPVQLSSYVAEVAKAAIVLLFIVQSTILWAQVPDKAAPVDQQTVRMLLERIDQLEARVAQLEAGRQTTSTAASSAVPASSQTSPQMSDTSSGSDQQEQNDQTEPERMDVSKTLLRIRGFGDINLHGDTGHGDTTSFSLGQLNLFITSDISEKFKFLSEIVFEGGPDNIYGVTRGPRNLMSVDVERYLLEYSYNDYLNISAGRYHTSIGYYNTAYHHGTWFQTTTGRPFLFQFEDRGGILPIHTVGVRATGLIPSGSLGLHYVAEVGNGRESRLPLEEEPVQNIVDEQNRKAFNLAMYARPDAIPGLQVGFSGYHDRLIPFNQPSVGETILAAHAVYIVPKFEWLNEALVVRHSPQGTSHVFQTPGFYSQISKQFGAYRPYFRYEYVNASDHEPIFPDVGLRHGPSVGLRYDASESVALKLQYDHIELRHQPAVNALGLQVGFTF
jgi:hypothetical protein